MSATDVPVGRALHLVDLENVLGDPWAGGPRVVATYEAVLERARRRAGDQVVVAVNPWMFRELAFADHTPCRLVIGRGPDGADLRLLECGSPEWIAQRFDRLVVASGDGIFAGIVDAVRALGLDVEVLYGRGAVSWRLCRVGVPRVRVPVDPTDPTDPGGDDHALAA